MKRTILLLGLIISFFAGFAQTQTALPVGTIAYGNQTYLSPDGGIWVGIAPKQFRRVQSKAQADSVIALYYRKIETDALLATKQNNLGFTPENSANKVSNLVSPNTTTYPNTQAVVNANNALSQNIIRFTNIYTPTAGGVSLTIPEFLNSVPLAIIRGNQEYKVSNTVTETTVTVNTANGSVTTYFPFGSGETIYGKYQGVTPGPILTDGFGFSVVQNYNDIFLNTHYGGTQQWDFFVTTDFQNNQGQKSKYQYTPGVGLGWIAAYFVN